MDSKHSRLLKQLYAEAQERRGGRELRIYGAVSNMLDWLDEEHSVYENSREFDDLCDQLRLIGRPSGS